MPTVQVGNRPGSRGGSGYRTGVGFADVLKTIVLLAIAIPAGFFIWQAITGSPQQVVQRMVDADLAGDSAKYAKCLTAKGAGEMANVNMTPLKAIGDMGMGMIKVEGATVGKATRSGSTASVPVTVKLSANMPGASQDVTFEYGLVREKFAWKVDLEQTKVNGMSMGQVMQSVPGLMGR